MSIVHPLTRQLRLGAFGIIIGCLAAGAAQADDSATPKHLRGTITSVSDSSFSVESTDGMTHQVTIGQDTRLAGVSQSSLDRIEEGTFIGTANMPGENGEPAEALEMVIFPESMKGTGEGDYPWDMPRGAGKQSGDDMAKSGKMGGSASSSTMTNGTVESTGGMSESGGKMGGSASSSTMTNGTVNSAADESGMMTLTVDYGDGSKQIRVPSDTPTVMVGKASMDDLEEGAAVFVAGDLSQDPIPAKAVIVGLDGTVPPM
ncbi:metal ABC transporter permease [Salinicola rhizosphaerae]|uniref:DUF5666 domain-containing protein n=1 Tax=Salinicola rhizosphaerae TaxID=1443141 RepID=A0ABQ3EFY6_9GAMM|nr:metal ABC transporter permease [Salinicola rhizosphaerae]GHB33632.1 hypothetical protein GCM10009038_35760 [Salinicola rhizosphaerae]